MSPWDSTMLGSTAKSPAGALSALPIQRPADQTASFQVAGIFWGSLVLVPLSPAILNSCQLLLWPLTLVQVLSSIPFLPAHSTCGLHWMLLCCAISGLYQIPSISSEIPTEPLPSSMVSILWSSCSRLGLLQGRAAALSAPSKTLEEGLTMVPGHLLPCSLLPLWPCS